MKTILSLLSVASLLLLSSCKKSSTNNSRCSLSSSSILGAYVRSVDLQQDTPSSPVIDLLAMEDPCERDDVLTFKTGGIYTWTDGATACNPSTLRSNGTWSLNGSTFTANGDVGTVESFDCKTLTIISSDANGNYKITTTLVRQ